MHISDFLVRVIKKLHIQKAVYIAARPFFNRNCKTDLQVAQQRLCDWHADPGRSCVCRNDIVENRFDLTIIIAAFNVEKYIVECLESILQQKTKYSFKIVVVDDGSADGTTKLLQEYSNVEKVEIIRKENGGAASARNRALQKLESTYVMFVDADDRLEKNAIESLLDKAYQIDADAVEGSYCLLTKQGKRAVRAHQDGEYDHALGVLTGFTCMKVIKSIFFQNVSFPEGYWFEDTVMSMILFPQMKKVGTISNTVYAYRVNDAGMTAAVHGSRKALDSFWIMRQMLLDHCELALEKDAAYYTQVLKQIAITFSRTEHVPEEIKQAIFIWSQAILKEYLPEVSLVQTDWNTSELYTAVNSGNYVRYSFFCKMIGVA